MIGLAHGLSPRKGSASEGNAFPLWAALFALILLGGCSGEFSALDPAGPAARSIARLWWVMLAGATLLFGLVMALYGLTLLKPGFGSRFSGRTWIVAGGLVLPIPVLTLLVHYALIEGEGLLPHDGEGRAPLRIEAQARMWHWEFRYPDAPGAPVSRDVLHLPAGRAIDVVATSADVIHGFWVPRLGGKVDAIPGHETRLRLLADAPGSHGGVCAEYCGIGHTRMRFRVEVHAAENYAAVLAGLAKQEEAP